MHYGYTDHPYEEGTETFPSAGRRSFLDYEVTQTIPMKRELKHFSKSANLNITSKCYTDHPYEEGTETMLEEFRKKKVDFVTQTIPMKRELKLSSSLQATILSASTLHRPSL